MNAGNQTKKPLNFARQMIWVFAVQMMLLVALVIWNEFIPTWANRLIIGLAISLPVLVYLPVLRKPEMRGLWLDLIRDCWGFSFVVARFLARLLRPATLAKMLRSLKPFPESVDEWITFCTFPFKAYIVFAFPVVWVSLKIIANFYPVRWVFVEMSGLIFGGYLLSLVALLFGAVVQNFFCRPERVTTTLRFVVYGFGFLLFWFLFPLSR